MSETRFFSEVTSDRCTIYLQSSQTNEQKRVSEGIYFQPTNRKEKTSPRSLYPGYGAPGCYDILPNLLPTLRDSRKSHTLRKDDNNKETPPLFPSKKKRGDFGAKSSLLGLFRAANGRIVPSRLLGSLRGRRIPLFRRSRTSLLGRRRSSLFRGSLCRGCPSPL